MPDSRHPYDGIADELLEWLESESTYYAEALKGGHRAPFAAATTEQEKHDFYARQMYKQQADGAIDYTSPNIEGRDMLLKRIGPAGYAQVAKAVMPAQGTRPDLQPESALEGSLPTDEIDQGLASG